MLPHRGRRAAHQLPRPRAGGRRQHLRAGGVQVPRRSVGRLSRCRWRNSQAPASFRLNAPGRPRYTAAPTVEILGISMTLLLKFQRAERCALFLGLAALVLLAGGWPGKAAAQQDLFRPAAVVNDDIISVLDVAMRLQLAIVAAGVEDSPVVRSSEEHTSELPSLMRISSA